MLEERVGGVRAGREVDEVLHLERAVAALRVPVVRAVLQARVVCLVKHDPPVGHEGVLGLGLLLGGLGLLGGLLVEDGAQGGPGRVGALGRGQGQLDGLRHAVALLPAEAGLLDRVRNLAIRGKIEESLLVDF